MPDLATQLKERTGWDCTDAEALERLRDMLIGETPALEPLFVYFDETDDA